MLIEISSPNRVGFNPKTAAGAHSCFDTPCCTRLSRNSFFNSQKQWVKKPRNEKSAQIILQNGTEALFFCQRLSASAPRPCLIGRKAKATPPNLPLSGEEPIARLNMLPPVKGGWGGVAFRQAQVRQPTTTTFPSPAPHTSSPAIPLSGGRFCRFAQSVADCWRGCRPTRRPGR